MSRYLLEVKNLKTYFYTKGKLIKAVDGIDFNIKEGETLGIVGESGSGKSVASLSLLKLIPSPPGKIVEGEVYFKGQNLLEKSEKEMRKIRGKDISMIFQEPVSCLNPVMTVGKQISEVIKLHQGLNEKRATQEALEMLKLVRISSPEKRMNQFPHQLSGGICQRVMIAMALSCRPSLLIADEPTTALDVTVQAQILELIKNLRDKFGTAVLLISHDLGVIAGMAQKVLVMYAGKVMEYADIECIFDKPKHPYTVELLNCVQRAGKLYVRHTSIFQTAPDLIKTPSGCRFHPRCPHVWDICKLKEPPIIDFDGGKIRCWKYSSYPML